MVSGQQGKSRACGSSVNGVAANRCLPRSIVVPIFTEGSSSCHANMGHSDPSWSLTDNTLMTLSTNVRPLLSACRGRLGVRARLPVLPCVIASLTRHRWICCRPHSYKAELDVLGIYSRGICCHYHSHDEGGDWEAGERDSNQPLCEYSLASNGGRGEGRPTSRQASCTCS